MIRSANNLLVPTQVGRSQKASQRTDVDGSFGIGENKQHT